MEILKRQKENHKGYMEVLTTPQRYNLWTQVWDRNGRTQAFGGWTHWKRDSDLCWADEGWKGNSVDLGPKLSRRGCQLIVLVTLRGCVEDVSGSVGKTASWNQFVLLSKLPLQRRTALEKLTEIGKSWSLLPPVHSPFDIPYWQSLTGNQPAGKAETGLAIFPPHRVEFLKG